MSHVLDRPAWNALATRHAALAEGGPLARRYPPAIIPFGAARDDGGESLAALAALLGPGETMLMAETAPLAIPPGLAVEATATIVQMILARPLPAVADPRITPLAEADAAEMLALATLTRPGPFTRARAGAGRVPRHPHRWPPRRHGRHPHAPGRPCRGQRRLQPSRLPRSRPRPRPLGVHGAPLPRRRRRPLPPRLCHQRRRHRPLQSRSASRSAPRSTSRWSGWA